MPEVREEDSRVGLESQHELKVFFFAEALQITSSYIYSQEIEHD